MIAIIENQLPRTILYIYDGFFYLKEESLDYEEIGLGDYEYRYYYKIEQSWEQAKITCENEGYYLTEITSLETLDNIRSFVGDRESFWVGGQYLDENELCTDFRKFIWSNSNELVWKTIENDKLFIELIRDEPSCCLRIFSNNDHLKGVAIKEDH